MPVHVDEMTTEVAAFEGEMPLSPEQLDRIVDLVMKRLEAREQEMKMHREATMIRAQARPGYGCGCDK